MCTMPHLVKYLLQPENSSNLSMDPFSYLVSDGKRYIDLICMIYLSERDDFPEVRHDILLLRRLDFKLSSSDRIPLAQLRFPRIHFDYICYVTLQNYLKTAAKYSQVPIFILF